MSTIYVTSPLVLQITHGQVGGGGGGAKFAKGPPASSGPEEGRSMRSTTDSANRNT